MATFCAMLNSQVEKPARSRWYKFLLRHASQSHSRVVDESMARFVAANRVRYVTLLRPRDSETIAV